MDVSFVKGKITVSLLADQGAYTNLIPSSLFKEIMFSVSDNEITELDPPHTYVGIF